MKTRTCLLLISALLAFWTHRLRAANDFSISANDKTRCRIIIPSNASASQRYAAEELQHYIERITSVRLAIADDSTKPESREILLGDNAHLRKLGVKIDFKALGQEGFAARTIKNKLIIAGGEPRGTLYGVYTLLEEQADVRWFTPEVEVVPRTNRLSLGGLNETRLPALEYREVFWTEMMRNPDFAARHRLNGEHYGLSEKHGGRAVVYFPFVHSFDNLIPRELYKDHPEYFPLIKSKRVDGYVQRCLSNPEVLKLAIAKVRQWIQEHPEATIISVSQNDTGNWCQCDACKTLDDQEGSPSASLIRFVNAVAADIEQDYPQIKIDTLAYQYTRKPPKTLRPRHNVIIRLCSIECCFAHPLASCDSAENRRFREDIVAWGPVAPKLYIWDYTPNFGHYQQPFPNFEAIQPNVRFFVQHGVSGLFEQGNYSGGGGGELGPLRAYLLAELLWNPDTDLDRETSEFLRAYYGSAAADLRAYLALLERQVSDGTIHAHIFDSPKARYLNDEFLSEANTILQTGEQRADNDTTRFRVAVARLPIYYVQLARGLVQGEQRSALLSKFLEIARKAGISNISESQSLDDWAKKLGTQ
ncbi:MAG TPA: DUF4838 domain-containing protein [Patescibacteria group bacterium]|nr:DUF4838 domain-containing protein [Patescibacteria group bacterium]